MTPPRPHAPAECAARLARVQAGLQARGLAGLLVTTEQEFCYFTGVLTRFWQSPSRPWFLILPAEGAPTAVVAEICAPLVARGSVTDIRTWPAPDDADNGIALLADTVGDVLAEGPLALPDGRESLVRLPFSDLQALRDRIAPRPLCGDGGLMRALRAVKSPAEVEAIAAICAIAGRAFARVPEIARAGVPLAQVFRDFQRLLLEEGADAVDYLAGAAGPLGYADVISPATDAPLAVGDVLMLDTGAVRQGYFCDFDRNFSVGTPDPRVADAHTRLLDACAAAQDAARPGATAADLFHAMTPALGPAAGGGRRGHGLGLQLTEGCSLLARDDTVLQPGMVLTLEPSVETAPGRIMVHEENIAITEGAARPLSPPAPRSIPVLEATP